MNDLGSQFSKFNLDAIKGVEYMELSGIGADELSDPWYFKKFMDIVSYYGSFDDGEKTMRKLSKDVFGTDRLTKLWEYADLRVKFDKEVECLTIMQETALPEEIKEQEKKIKKIKGMIRIYE